IYEEGILYPMRLPATVLVALSFIAGGGCGSIKPVPGRDAGGDADGSVETPPRDGTPSDAAGDGAAADGPLVCPPALPTACGNTCVDTTATAAHCGGCDQACPARANTTATCSG